MSHSTRHILSHCPTHRGHPQHVPGCPAASLMSPGPPSCSPISIPSRWGRWARGPRQQLCRLGGRTWGFFFCCAQGQAPQPAQAPGLRLERDQTQKPKALEAKTRGLLVQDHERPGSLAQHPTSSLIQDPSLDKTCCESGC